MTAQPVAASPTDHPPSRAADPVAAATNDFAQLLSDAAAPATDAACSAGTATSTSGANSTGSVSTTNSGPPTTGSSATGRTAKKTDDSASNPTIVAVALQLQQHVPTAKTQATDPAPTQADPTTDTKVAAASTAVPTGVHIPMGSATSPTDPAAPLSANTAANPGNAAPRPDVAAGAAETNARISVGPPSYFSQPNAMLTGAARPATAAADDSTGDDDDTDASSVGNTAMTGVSAKATITANVVLSTQWHDPSGTDPTGATPSDAGPASDPTAAPTSDATSFALPLSSDNQTAAPLSTATTAATAAPNLAPPPVYEQVAFSLRQAADGDGGLSTINIQLKPASLGAIQVKLDVGHDGKISAVISADRSDTLNLLRQDSQGLEQALRDAGLRADSGSLSFNLRGEQQSFAQNSSNGASAPASTTQANPSTSGAPTPRYSRHSGALDIEV
jgi:flagellar hook-length control protein FliK